METHVLWLKALSASLSGLAARIIYALFHDAPEPPEDPAERRRWRRQRSWIVISELGALPAMAFAWAEASRYWDIPVPLMALGALASGALGFGFLLDSLRRIVNRKINGG